MTDSFVPLRVVNELPRPSSPEWHEQPRRPEWLRIRLRTTGEFSRVRDMMSGLSLHTVCQEARCPNIYECWSEGTATFMILGDVCTRACGYCAVKTGKQGLELDASEPQNVADAVLAMRLDHAVVTSVDRDDLPDFGSEQFVRTLLAIRKASPNTRVEVLIPDFGGDWSCLDRVLQARPDVLNHNTETVPSLYRRARSKGVYPRCLELLRRAAEFRDREHPSMLVKSGLMVGLGETVPELLDTLREVRAQGTDILTLGQYMRPTMKHLPVERFYPPEEFEHLREQALAMGYRFVESGPLVRSSYHAKRHRQGAEAQQA
ncbi:MAG: lipoyl synthase [Candidatus Eremiobacterota bacterium]